MPVHDHRDVEPQGQAGPVAPGILLTIVEFVGDICSIVSVENCRLVAPVPNLGAEHPHDTIFGSVGGHDWGRGYTRKSIAAGGFERELAVLHCKLAKRVAVAQHIEKMIPIR